MLMSKNEKKDNKEEGVGEERGKRRTILGPAQGDFSLTKL
jgi:hypothetical protein